MAAKKTRKSSDRDWDTREQKWLKDRVWLPRQDSIGPLDRTVYLGPVGSPGVADRLIRPRAPKGVFAPAKQTKKKNSSKKA